MPEHQSDVIMSAMASQLTSVSVVCLTVCSCTDQRNISKLRALAFVRGIHRWSLDSPHKGPVTRKMFPFDDVIMERYCRIWNRSPTLYVCWRPRHLQTQLWQNSDPVFTRDRHLAHLSLDKITAFSQTIFSSALSWMKSFVFFIEISLTFVSKGPIGFGDNTDLLWWNNVNNQFCQLTTRVSYQRGIRQPFKCTGNHTYRGLKNNRGMQSKNGLQNLWGNTVFLILC